MRSLPGSLLVLGRAYIYHPALSTDLRSGSYPWRSGSNLFGTLVPVGLVECTAVPVEKDGGGGPYQYKIKYPFLLAIDVQPRERFVKAPLAQHTVY